MSAVRWHNDNPNVYLYVNSRWYRFDRTSQPVGEGAMGVVYLGFDCETNQKVAVKMLKQELWGIQSIRDRLKLEASIQMNHPHIINMIGYCEDDSHQGPLFVLSEYVCGVTFKEHVQQQIGYLDVKPIDKYNKIVSEFLPILSAVKYLHSYGVIHRDIKPLNIMFQDGYHLKLMDLGIAKADYFFDAHLKGFIGSKPFAAPEQVVADDVEAKVDRRSDIYSLGVTLSYLLVEHYPPQIQDKLPAKLYDIILKATSIKPEDRYQYADDMARDIELYLENTSRPSSSIVKYIVLIFIILSLLGTAFIIVKTRLF